MSSHSSGPTREPRPPTTLPPRLLAEPESDRYEYRHLSLPRGTTRGQARELLTEQADHGRWELSRVTLFRGGARQVRLRRRIIRVQRTT